MIRRITLGAATALLVVGLPVAALGFSQGLDDDSAPSVTPEAAELSQEMELEAQEQIGTPPVDAIQVEAQVQSRRMPLRHKSAHTPASSTSLTRQEPVSDSGCAPAAGRDPPRDNKAIHWLNRGRSSCECADKRTRRPNGGLRLLRFSRHRCLRGTLRRCAHPTRMLQRIPGETVCQSQTSPSFRFRWLRSHHRGSGP